MKERKEMERNEMEWNGMEWNESETSDRVFIFSLVSI